MRCSDYPYAYEVQRRRSQICQPEVYRPNEGRLDHSDRSSRHKIRNTTSATKFLFIRLAHGIGAESACRGVEVCLRTGDSKIFVWTNSITNFLYLGNRSSSGPPERIGEERRTHEKTRQRKRLSLACLALITCCWGTF